MILGRHVASERGRELLVARADKDWPGPKVFTLSDLWRRAHHLAGRRFLDPLVAFSWIHTQHPALGLHALARVFRIAKNFAELSFPPSSAPSAIDYLESRLQSAELSEVSLGLLSYAFIEARAASEDLLWSGINHTIPTKHSPTQLFQRPNSPQHMILSGEESWRELQMVQHLDNLIPNLLRTRAPEAADTSSILKKFKSIPTMAPSQCKQNDIIYMWLFEREPPPGWVIRSMLPSSTLSPIHQQQQPSQPLASITRTAQAARDFLSALARTESSDRAQAIQTLTSDFDHRSLSHTLINLGLVKAPKPTNLKETYIQATTGTSVLSIHDAMILEPKSNVAIWSDQSGLESLAHGHDSHEAFQPSHQDLNPFLESIFTAEQLPFPKRELAARKALAHLLETQSETLWRVSVNKKVFPSAQPPTVAQPAILPSDFTASSIESYSRCPQQFLAQHVLRIQDPQVKDDLDQSPSFEGQVLHKVLENTLKQPPDRWSIDFIRTEYDQALLRLCKDRFSKNHLDLFIESKEPKCQRIWKFSDSFLRSALQVLRPKSIDNELPTRGTISGLSLKGRPDLLIQDQHQKWHLWDFKSTRQNASATLQTLYDNSKLQLLTYGLLHAGNVNQFSTIAYLHPLEPSSSRIFLLPGAGLELKQLAEDLEIPTTTVDQEQLDAAIDQLKTLCTDIQTSIKDWHFPHTPRKSSYCSDCSSRTFCGKPYFAEAGDDL